MSSYINLIRGETMKMLDVLKVVLPQRLFSVIALLRFMGIILVPNSGEANLANDPANNRWKYGLGTLLRCPVRRDQRV